MAFTEYNAERHPGDRSTAEVSPTMSADNRRPRHGRPHALHVAHDPGSEVRLRRAVSAPRTRAGRTMAFATRRTSGTLRSRRASSSRRAGTSRSPSTWRVREWPDRFRRRRQRVRRRDAHLGDSGGTRWSMLVAWPRERRDSRRPTPVATGRATGYLANLAAGDHQYFSSLTISRPLGDLERGSTSPANLIKPIDDRRPKDTFLSFTPGFRTHLGANWSLPGGIEVPVINPKPFNFQILGGLMKVF